MTPTKSEISQYQKKYYQDHKEEKLKKRKKHYEEKKEQEREYNKKYQEENRPYLMRKYNITKKDYNITFENQKGCCAICGKHQKELKTALCVDHNHETGEIRGLLCDNCNKAIGFMFDNPDILLKAIKYLEKSTS